jgi:hypothetical protein
MFSCASLANIVNICFPFISQDNQLNFQMQQSLDFQMERGSFDSKCFKVK